MKKILLIILAFVYLSSTTGATLSMHYCMGKPADWRLGDNNSKKCGKCGMDQTGNGCCKDESKFFKNDIDQKTTESSFQLIQLIAVVLPPYSVEILSNDFPFERKENPICHAPPRSNGIVIYIRNCVFLI